MRTLLIVLALLSVTPAMADSVLMAAINRARTEARCPLYPKATAVREVVCDSASAPAECTAGHSDQGHQRVSAMAITARALYGRSGRRTESSSGLATVDANVD